MKKLTQEESLALVTEQITRYKQVRRDASHIDREYNVEKYGSMMNVDFASPQEARLHSFQQVKGADERVVLSLKDDFYSCYVTTGFVLNDDILRSLLLAYRSPNYCELGCGFGKNLELVPPGTTAYGGEYTENGVKLAKKFGFDVQKFDYYDLSTYHMIRPNSTIFTVSSVEQIPSAKPIIDNLRAFKDRINWVVHFEPFQVWSREGKLGELRNKYTELNNYNKDLFSCVDSSDIEIKQFELDALGLNPLNPSHILVWRFR